MAATLTWVLPAGDYNRRHDDATGRDVVEAGTYHRVPSAPVGPFSAVVAVPRGFVEAADVIGVVLFVGAAWIVIDRVGTLSRLVGALVAAFNGRGLVAVPFISLFFAAMGALENMQEEIIPLVPALLLLGRGLGLDPVAVVAMTTGAAAVGSAFGPSNPFQAGIAMKLAQLPPGRTRRSDGPSARLPWACGSRGRCADRPPCGSLRWLLRKGRARHRRVTA